MKCHTVLITTVVLEFTCSKLQKACISFPSQVVSIFIRVRGIVKWNKLTKSFADLIVCVFVIRFSAFAGSRKVSLQVAMSSTKHQ